METKFRDNMRITGLKTEETDSTNLTPISKTIHRNCSKEYGLNQLLYFDTPAFKKNDTVKFKYRGKIRTGKVIKIGAQGIDVLSNKEYYYCYDWDHKIKFFRQSNKTKNYKTNPYIKKT